MLSNTLVKLTAVFLLATPAVLVGGQLYSILTGTPPLEGFLKIYSVLYLIPGELLTWLPKNLPVLVDVLHDELDLMRWCFFVQA